MVKHFNSLKAADADSEAYLKKLGMGEMVRVRVTKPRNIKFHRKFFALLNLGFENQDIYTDFEHWRRAVTIEAGYFEDLRMIDGTTQREAKSISFARMDELEFSNLYYAVLDVIAKFLGSDDETLAREVESFAGSGLVGRTALQHLPRLR